MRFWLLESSVDPIYRREWCSYRAPVIKEKAFQLDGVFTPLTDDPMVPVVFAAALMQTDENFYRRFFAEIFLYLEHYKVTSVES